MCLCVCACASVCLSVCLSVSLCVYVREIVQTQEPDYHGSFELFVRTKTGISGSYGYQNTASDPDLRRNRLLVVCVCA